MRREAQMINLLKSLWNWFTGKNDKEQMEELEKILQKRKQHKKHLECWECPIRNECIHSNFEEEIHFRDFCKYIHPTKGA